MTPKETKLKSDALLELKEINIQINEAKAKLEAINAECVAAASNLTSIRNKERDFKLAMERIGGKFDAIADPKESEIKDLDAEIASRKKELDSVLAVKREVESDIASLQEKKEFIIQGHDEKIKEKESLIQTLEHDIQEKSEQATSAKKSLNDTISKDLELSERIAIRSKELSDREEKVEAREKICAQNGSEVRVWAVRLYNKYEKFMTDREKSILEEYKQ